MPEDPQQYVPYPVGGQYGTVERLQALADGYFGLNMAFVVNLIYALCANAYFRFSPFNLGAMVTIYAVLFFLVTFLTLPHNKKIALGMGWGPVAPIIASVLIGLNSALCCGIIGYVVMQSIAMGEMKKYGLKIGFFGGNKKNVQAFIDNMKAQTMQPRPPAQ